MTVSQSLPRSHQRSTWSTHTRSSVAMVESQNHREARQKSALRWCCGGCQAAWQPGCLKQGRRRESADGASSGHAALSP